MKLLTHNLLTSRHRKGVVTGYPLKLVVDHLEPVKTNYNYEFLQRMMPKIDYLVLKEAAKVCGVELPEMTPSTEGDEDTLKLVHKALFEIEVITGHLICPETGRKFPITDGIPNMLVNEDEV